MLQSNTIYCGDNLPVLQGFEDESVDLVYIDPPFFTSKQYEVIWKDGAEVRQFEDRWVKMGETGRYSKDINTYLEFMEPRIKEIYRVLKKTGSFYLHCDWHADAYLRVLCDQIFGYGHLVNEIVWNFGNRATVSRSGFPSKHDNIYWYSKGDIYTYNEILKEYKDKDMKRYNQVDEEGKKYALIKRVRSNTGEIYYGKCYPREGVPETDVWDIPTMSSTSSERLGYPTQKPEALLERIILASSNEGDVVLDAFCGCGTTLAVAKRLKRHFVGIDVSPTACRLVAKRIGYSLATIIGLPLTAEEIVGLTGYEFQNAIITLLDPSLETIKVGNKGADGGIDGSYYDLPISVKKYKAGRKDLDEFVATLYRNKKTVGLFAALEFSSDFLKEVARLGREQGITLHHYTFAQVIAGEHKKIMSEENKQHGKLF